MAVPAMERDLTVEQRRELLAQVEPESGPFVPRQSGADAIERFKKMNLIFFTDFRTRIDNADLDDLATAAVLPQL